MTLVVAGIAGDTAWMVADAAVTGGTLSLRTHENQIKVVPSIDDRGLIGFAGDHHHGTRVMEETRCRSSGPNVVAELLNEHRAYPSVDFAYSYRDESGPHLIRISDGKAEELNTLHIGSADAFAAFQAIRHRPKIEPIPDSFATLMLGTRGNNSPPQILAEAIDAMLRLVGEHPHKDVGGFALPYVLTNEGAFLCSYGYSVSDPILPTIVPGSLVSHGTAPAGGFALSLTEYPERGVIAYWLQKPGGIVFQRTSAGYSALDFEGTPEVFKQAALAALGKPIEIWFGEGHQKGIPDRLTIVRGSDGQPAFTIAEFGNDLSISALNVATEFLASAELGFPGMPMSHTTSRTSFYRITTAADSEDIVLELSYEGDAPTKFGLRPTSSMS